MSKHFKTITTTFDDPGEFDFSDAKEAYGEVDEFGFIDTPCDLSPSGQCEYDALRDAERCIHCGRKTG